MDRQNNEENQAEEYSMPKLITYGNLWRLRLLRSRSRESPMVVCRSQKENHRLQDSLLPVRRGLSAGGAE